MSTSPFPSTDNSRTMFSTGQITGANGPRALTQKGAYGANASYWLWKYNNNNPEMKKLNEAIDRAASKGDKDAFNEALKAKESYLAKLSIQVTPEDKAQGDKLDVNNIFGFVDTEFKQTIPFDKQKMLQSGRFAIDGDSFDKDEDGALSKSELARVFGTANPDKPNEPDLTDVDKVIKAMDQNGDGKIQRWEFAAFRILQNQLKRYMGTEEKDGVKDDGKLTYQEQKIAYEALFKDPEAMNKKLKQVAKDFNLEQAEANFNKP